MVLFFFQKDDITIRFWYLHLGQMSWTEFAKFCLFVYLLLEIGFVFIFKDVHPFKKKAFHENPEVNLCLDQI